MSARLLAGKFHADAMLIRAEKKVASLPFAPRLAIIIVGNDPASVKYVEKKAEAGRKIGMEVDIIQPIDMQSARQALTRLENDKDTHGIILQLPLPPGFEKSELIGRIPLLKDVDGLRKNSPFTAATVCAIEEILTKEDVSLTDKKIAVVGAKGAVGSKLVRHLKQKGIVPLVADIDTEDLSAITLDADIIISSTGIPGIITEEIVNENAVVVDVGFTLVDGRIKGDVDPMVTNKVAALSPVPGGVGPLTVACLIKNTVQAAVSQYKARESN
jgi:methylenetetrahydrofolate dehydrogenase (NADP+)/methenyltetrahydrofolate cyclohydrolase